MINDISKHSKQQKIAQIIGNTVASLFHHCSVTVSSLSHHCSITVFGSRSCISIRSITTLPRHCKRIKIFGGRDGGLWEWPDSSCHSLVGSFKIEIFFSGALLVVSFEIQLASWPFLKASLLYVRLLSTDLVPVIV